MSQDKQFYPQNYLPVPVPATLEQAIRERNGWCSAAAQHLRNEEFYRDIVCQIGDMFGVAARTSDDGSVQDGVLALRVPELVSAALATRTGSETAAVDLDAVCEPWKYSDGPPPEDDSPLSGVFVAGMTYTESLLAKFLGVKRYEGGDGSEDFDADATMTLQNIMVAAGLYDADECRLAALSAAPAAERRDEAAAIDALADRLVTRIEQRLDALCTTTAPAEGGQS